MKAISILLLLCFLSNKLCAENLYKCQSKSLFKASDSLVLEATDGDVIKAYNEVASCASLDTDDDEYPDDLYTCCYIKLKIKNEQLDEKFDQKGCIQMSVDDYIIEDFDFKDYVDDVKEFIELNNTNITVKKISIDCSSKYLQFVAISLILFLL